MPYVRVRLTVHNVLTGIRKSSEEQGLFQEVPGEVQEEERWDLSGYVPTDQ